jgi:predicted DNA-binding protein (UPF0251 family)
VPRPRSPRRLRFSPHVTYFKPRGIPLQELAEVSLARDEVEALKLHDLEHYSQQEAAEQMHVSQPTFARILASAHHKLAQGIIHGQAIRLSTIS